LSPIFVTRLNLFGPRESSQVTSELACKGLSERMLSLSVGICPQEAKAGKIRHFELEDRCSIH